MDKYKRQASQYWLTMNEIIVSLNYVIDKLEYVNSKLASFDDEIISLVLSRSRYVKGQISSIIKNGSNISLNLMSKAKEYDIEEEQWLALLEEENNNQEKKDII